VQRLIDQPRGEGVIFEAGAPVARVHYHLSVYQHFSDVEGELVPAAIEVEGRVVFRDGVDLAELKQRDADLTLRLADGRFLDFSTLSADGAIRSTGRGLFRE
jgi:hypothetical protein